MRSLEKAAELEQLEARLGTLSPDDTRLWGVMNAHEAVIHVREAFRAAQGERVVGDGPMPLPIPPALLKFLALNTPFRWRRNVSTVPGLKVGAPEMPAPREFNLDRADTVTQLRRFVTMGSLSAAHPMFGPMSTADWMRWGWLHMDHHLRQFGR